MTVEALSVKSHHITDVQLRPGTLKRIILHNKGTNPYLFLLCDE